MPTPDAQPRDAFLQLVLSQVRVTTLVCTRQAVANGYKLPRRTVTDYNLIFCTRGKVVWVVEDEPHELSPVDLIVVPPNVPHHAYSKTKRMTIGSVHVTAKLPGGQDVFEILIPARVRHVSRRSRLDQYLQMNVDEYNRADVPATQLTMSAWGRLITLELFRYDAAHGLLKQRPIDPLVAEMVDELSKWIDKPVSLDDLAAQAGYSPQHLNRVFRRVLGVTPLQHLTRLRMERAAALLAEGQLTIKAIAPAVGIDDPYYFSRVFRQHFGRSPAQYRTAAGSNSPS